MWRIIRRDAVSVLEDKNARESLKRYFDVMQGDKPAKFLIAKKIPADFDEDDSLRDLWDLHEDLLDEFTDLQQEIDTRVKRLDDLETPEKSFLDLKERIATRILESCHFCTRRCGVNRLKGEMGYCRCGSQIVVSSIFEHLGEEPELVPSGTIFTMGCTINGLRAVKSTRRRDWHWQLSI